MDPHLTQPSAPVDDGSQPKYSKEQAFYSGSGRTVDLLFLQHIDGADIWFDPTDGTSYPYLIDRGAGAAWFSGLRGPVDPVQSFIHIHRSLTRGLLVADELDGLLQSL